MGDLVSALKSFLRRDFAILLGGAVTVAAFLENAGALPPLSDNLPITLLLAGISYGVGYAVQSVFEFCRIATTTPLRRLGWIGMLLYKLLEQREWRDVPQAVDFSTVWGALNENQRADCERIIGLKMMGSAFGSGSVVAGMLMLNVYRTASNPSDLWLAIGSLIVGLVLIIVGRIKAAQQAKFYEDATRAA